MPGPEEANAQLVQGLYAAFGRGDVNAVLAALAEDVDWRYLGPASIPFAGVFRGRAEAGRFFAALGQSLDVERFDVREIVAQGKTVVVLGGERMKVKATGRAYETEWAHVFTVEGGKIETFREHTDSAAVAAAFAGR